MSIGALNALVVFLLFILTFVFAFLLNKKFKQENPNFLSYAWGFWHGFLTIAVGVSLILVALFAVIDKIGDTQGLFYKGSEPWRWVYFLIFAFMPITIGYFILLRKKWALVTVTFLTCTPILWIITGIYIKNRNEEYKTPYNPFQQIKKKAL